MLVSKVSMFSYIQIFLAILLGILILIQQSESSLGSSFGGGDNESLNRTRRGLELWIFRATIIIACLFIASTIINLIQ